MGGPGWQLDWGPTDRLESVTAVRAAVSAGVGWIDTAPFYGWGHAEQIVGSALEGLASRPAVLTKRGDVHGRDGRAVDDHSPQVIRADVRASLRRLRCPVIDVLHLHDPDPTAVAAGWALEALPIIGARTAAEASQISAVKPVPPDVAAAAQAAADAALAVAR
jgi:aryl-alcohol dehydrogenase-like predicted oxidoreductase